MAAERDDLARCPFYKKVNGDDRRIKCEGLTENASCFSQYFYRKEGKQDWRRIFCDDIHRHMECPVYELIMEKYK